MCPDCQCSVQNIVLNMVGMSAQRVLHMIETDARAWRFRYLLGDDSSQIKSDFGWLQIDAEVKKETE